MGARFTALASPKWSFMLSAAHRSRRRASVTQKQLGDLSLLVDSNFTGNFARVRDGNRLERLFRRLTLMGTVISILIVKE
jgi:hypothetical protein